MPSRRLIQILSLSLLLGACLNLKPTNNSKQSTTTTTTSKPTTTTTSKPTTTSQTVSGSKLEEEFIKILKADKRQTRKTITVSPILTRVARERARDMAQRNYFSHTNPDGNGPNYLLTQAGYQLPTWWGKERDANNIESISGGRATAQDTYTGWMNSPGHKRHVLAEIDFYSGQTVVGIGYHYEPNSTYKHYWVFLSAPPQ